MKFGVFVALVGIATAIRVVKEEEVPAPSPMPPSGDETPTESQLKLMAEIAQKGANIKKT